MDQPVPFSPNDVSAPAANAAAVVVYGAAGGAAHVVSGLLASYAGSGTLAGGNLKVEDGATTVLSVDLEAKGTLAVPFDPPMRSSPGRSLTATLAAGGANVSGKLTVLGHRLAAAPPAQAGCLDFMSPANSGYAAIL